MTRYGRHYCKEVEISECYIPANAQLQGNLLISHGYILIPQVSSHNSRELEENMWRFILHVPLTEYGTGTYFY